MSQVVQTISLGDLLVAFLPVLCVIFILFRWSLDYRHALYALFRMLLQLLLIGYFLTFIFESNSSLIVLAVLVVMVCASSWIALDVIADRRREFLWLSFVSILLSGSITLAVVTVGVLQLDPWYLAQYMIPLAGMIFANAMTTISLAAERLISEAQRGVAFIDARNIAFRAALIPIINSLFAVGLVSLPGMMTGQILSGTSPLVAARYQIMVMCMIFGSAGIAAAIFLHFVRAYYPSILESNSHKGESD